MKTHREARAWSSRLAACRCLPVVLTIAALSFMSCQGGAGGGGEPSPEPSVTGDKGTVVTAAVIPPGGEVCGETGGVHIDWGIDLDADGVLDEDEITGSGDICNGAAGTAGLATLVKTSALPLQDANCPAGGVKIEMGGDADGDGVLDAAEVNATLTQFVCNGAGGITGAGMAVQVSTEPAGDNCPAGGTKIEGGPDTDGNGAPDSIAFTTYVCNGAAGGIGQSTLVKTSTLPLLDGNCPAGGAKVEVGVDANGNGTLDTAEVNPTLTQYVCNGAGGSAGIGAAVQITQDPPECPNGGVKIESGPDADNNGVPDSVPFITYVCDGAAGSNGVDGFTTLIEITTELAGDNCPFGGQRIVKGLDNGDGGGTARDGILDAGEIDGLPQYVCAYGAGKAEGSGIAALTLTAGQVYHGSVSAGGTSYYRWTAPEAAAALIGLARTESDLAWTVYSDAFVTPQDSCDNLDGSDGDEFCITSVLTEATDYFLGVTEKSNIPNLFDLYLNAPVLLAADPVGRIYRIDLEAGTTHFLSNTGIADLSAMAWAPQSGAVWAGTGFADPLTCAGCLYSIDPFTGWSGLARDYNPDATPHEPASLVDLSVDPDSGLLYGFESSECDAIYRIAAETLDPTVLVLPYNQSGGTACSSTGLAMTFDGSGFLYLTADINPAGPLYLWSTDVAATPSWQMHPGISFQNFGPEDPFKAYLVSMTASPADGKVYGIAVFEYVDGSYLSFYTYKHFLVSMDLTSSYANYLAELPVRLDALAFVGGGRVPWVANLRDIHPTSGTEVAWARYRNAVYNVYWVLGEGPIDPGDPGTYDTLVPDLTSTNYFTFEACGNTYTFLVAAEVGGNEVAYSNQIPVAANPCP